MRDFKPRFLFQRLKAGFPKVLISKKPKSGSTGSKRLSLSREKSILYKLKSVLSRTELNKVTAEKLEAEKALSAETSRQAQERN